MLNPYKHASVYGAYYRIEGSNALSIGTQPVQPDSNGLYQVPQWDGQWYYLPGKTVNAQPLLLDMVYDGVTDGGYSTYYSWVSMASNGYHNDATLVTFADRSTDQYDIMITPYSITKDGGEIYGRSMDQFEPGTLVRSYSTGFTKEGEETGPALLSRTTVVPGMSMQYTLLPDGTYAAGIMAYYDDDDKVLAEEFRIITIRNGVLVNTSIGPLSTAWTERKPPLFADFTVSPVKGTAPLKVKCSDISTGDPTRYQYNFGDGTSMTGPTPVHIYRNPGTYTVTLTVMKYDAATGSMATNSSIQKDLIVVKSK